MDSYDLQERALDKNLNLLKHKRRTTKRPPFYTFAISNIISSYDFRKLELDYVLTARG